MGGGGSQVDVNIWSEESLADFQKRQTLQCCKQLGGRKRKVSVVSQHT